MSIFNIISLFGGLAMFLYGMRLMGNSLKEGSSGTLKTAMEKVTNNPLKAFLLGVLITAVIQSSTATIVITSGLVAAGVIKLKQSLGIIVGANVGTTVTGQIIRLLDVDGSSAVVLRFFQPSTLAPLALIAGIVLIMGFSKFKKTNNIGSICIGFGILFSGLLNMTSAVSVLSENGMLDSIFLSIGDKMWLGYLVGAGVAFVLQSSSATIGILQAFSMASVIPFKTVYIMLTGIYLGDCITTAIVCSIGAKANQKRVGALNVMFNLSETVLVLIVVNILHLTGVLDGLWNMPMSPGTIANTNTVFNLACAITLLPLMSVYEKFSRKIIRDDRTRKSIYDEKLQALNPVFFETPAIAFNSCYEVLKTMLELSRKSIDVAVKNLKNYNRAEISELMDREDDIDMLTDNVGNYLVELSPNIVEDLHIRILNQYNRLVNEFERLGDHGVNIAEVAMQMHESNITFSEMALKEIDIAKKLLDQIMDYTWAAFERRDISAAQHIEPLEDVMDDIINTLHDNHLNRLRAGECTINAGTAFLDVLSNLERISDICSNVGIGVVARVRPELASLAHNYVSSLHAGSDNQFKAEYEKVHEIYFAELEQLENSFPEETAALPKPEAGV
ncbi:MAG: Na/Pi cotransporter family protein [Parasporobacterium sp.]|nr:Na/Pi cotransporter family protein [Parasporobacterium sp.]